MFESFFGFSSRPFPAVPHVRRFFPGENVVQARDTLHRTIERSEGPALLVGPAGVGKTLLLNVIASRFRNVFQIAHLECGQLSTTRQFLQSVLHELRQPFRGLDEGELRLSLLDALEPGEECPHGLLLLVDEAHQLSVEMLEEVRLLSNLVREGEPRVRVVLSGNGRLEERFTRPELESFNQRLAARCYLHGFTSEETRDYIAAMTEAAGGHPESIWSGEAVKAIHLASDGVPRLINQLCDHALMVAAEAEQRRVEAAHVEQAWAQLQQLPAPWNTAESESECVIEFGELDEPLEFSAETPESQPETQPETQLETQPETQLEIFPQPVQPVGPAQPARSAQTIQSAQPATHAAPQSPPHNLPSAATEIESLSELPDAGPNIENVITREYELDSPQNGYTTHEVSLSTDGMEQAAQIELRLAEVEFASGVAEPPPATPAPAPEVDDPFGQFPEEEVILDEFLALGESNRTLGPRVSSLESRLLAEALEIHHESIAPAAGHRESARREPPQRESAQRESAQREEHHSEPHHSEPHHSELHHLDREGPQCLSLQDFQCTYFAAQDLDDEDEFDPPKVVPMFAASRDDREIIVVEDDEPQAGGTRTVIEKLRS